MSIQLVYFQEERLFLTSCKLLEILSKFDTYHRVEIFICHPHYRRSGGKIISRIRPIELVSSDGICCLELECCSKRNSRRDSTISKGKVLGLPDAVQIVYGSVPAGFTHCDGVQLEDAFHRSDRVQSKELGWIEHRANERGGNGLNLWRAFG